MQKHTTTTPGAARAPGPRKISCRGHGQALTLTLDLSDVAFLGNRTNMLTRSTAAVPKTRLSVTQTCGASESFNAPRLHTTRARSFLYMAVRTRGKSRKGGATHQAARRGVAARGGAAVAGHDHLCRADGAPPQRQAITAQNSPLACTLYTAKVVLVKVRAALKNREQTRLNFHISTLHTAHGILSSP
eukprot:6180362-Pleurochrysis_carterae.AAC.1